MEYVLPYVYKITNKITGEFYIGSRWANKTPSFIDLGETYFSSSKSVAPLVKKDKSNFILEVISERKTNVEVHLIEHKLILENWGNPLLLNKMVHKNGHFICNGPNKHSTETKQKMSSTRKGKKKTPFSEEAKNNMRKPKSEQGKENIRLAAQKRDKTKLNTPESIEKANLKKKGKKQTSNEIEKRMNGVRKYNANNPDKVLERTRKSAETRKKNKTPAPNNGIPHSEEAKANMRKPKKTGICPHCGYEGGMHVINRMHMDKCKYVSNIEQIL